jgi:hypothetical protein
MYWFKLTKRDLFKIALYIFNVVFHTVTCISSRLRSLKETEQGFNYAITRGRGCTKDEDLGCS